MLLYLQTQQLKSLKGAVDVNGKLNQVVVTSQAPRKKPPTKLEDGARGGYWELFMNWNPMFALPSFLIIFPAAQAARTFSDIWISQWTARKNRWSSQVLTEWEFYAVYVGFVVAFFLMQVLATRGLSPCFFLRHLLACSYTILLNAQALLLHTCTDTQTHTHNSKFISTTLNEMCSL
jgi:hypothetical protein